MPEAIALLAARLVRRTARALLRPPGPRDIGRLALTAVVLALTAGPLLFRTGLIVWRPVGLDLGHALGVLAVPALGEELLFRGPWISDRIDSERVDRDVWAGVILSTLAFIGWHGLETLWLPGAARLFLRADFLTWAGLLGLACAYERRASGSIWPPTLLHAAAVILWQGWLGGPVGLEALR